MNLRRALIILIEDWQEKLKAGETRVPLEEVMQTLAGEAWRGMSASLTPGQIATLIDQDLEEVGMREAALKTVLPYPTKQDLLEERDLLSLLPDCGI